MLDNKSSVDQDNNSNTADGQGPDSELNISSTISLPKGGGAIYSRHRREIWILSQSLRFRRDWVSFQETVREGESRSRSTVLCAGRIRWLEGAYLLAYAKTLRQNQNILPESLGHKFKT